MEDALIGNGLKEKKESDLPGTTQGKSHGDISYCDLPNKDTAEEALRG